MNCWTLLNDSLGRDRSLIPSGSFRIDEPEMKLVVFNGQAEPIPHEVDVAFCNWITG
jgi:hypothetical protein